MAEITSPAPQRDRRRRPQPRLRGFVQATEIDTRLLGMIVALAIIWIGFQFLSGDGANPFERFASGVFLTPRNLWNLSVQTSSVAVMATGMVLVIVSRNIDLSVGSLVGFVGMIMGVHPGGAVSPAGLSRARSPGDLGHRAGHRAGARRPRSARCRATSSPISASPPSS